MHKLEYLKAKFGNLPKQGSMEWLEARKFSFGGSEMATVCNNNPYETFDKLVRKKILKENDTDDPRQWGILFEPVSKAFIELERQTKIHDFSSIPHSSLPVTYSPDGLIVDGDDLVLLEIKNPIWRDVSKIPVYYLDQVNCGMDIFPVKHCLFAQFQFRRCPIYTDVWSQTYDRYYHRESRVKVRNKSVIVFGYLVWDIDCPLVDLGSEPSISVHTKGLGKPRYIYNEVFHAKRGYVMLWKLFDVSYEFIPPTPNYLHDKSEYLWKQYKRLYEKIKN